MSDVLIVIAENGFQDFELEYTKRIIEQNGFSITIASKTAGRKKGAFGAETEADLALKDCTAEEYNALVFIGGSGAQQYFADEEALNLARDFYKKGKIIGAICIAPLILANAGLLKEKKATVWDDEKGGIIFRLEKQGAKYTGKEVEVDGNIITANGPDAAISFGQEISKKLSEIE